MDEGRRRKDRVGSLELRKEENGETRHINRHIASQIHRETNRAMDERPGAPWMCYFSEARFWGSFENGRVKLTEFVKNAKRGQDMTVQ